MGFANRFVAPQPQLYDVYFERERDTRMLSDLSILPVGSISHYGGHACTKALLTSDQRADLSKHASLRPIGGR